LLPRVEERIRVPGTQSPECDDIQNLLDGSVCWRGPQRLRPASLAEGAVAARGLAQLAKVADQGIDLAPRVFDERDQVASR
jgi:hypothetical protein